MTQSRKIKFEKAFEFYEYEEFDDLTDEILPCFYLNSNKENTITNIQLFFKDENTSCEYDIEFRPTDWFLEKFWKEKIDKKKDKYSNGGKMRAWLGGLKSNEPNWKRFKKKAGYSVCFVINEFDKIWNEYCLHTGSTTISRQDFCLWIYRLNCLIYDLIERPLNEVKNWKKWYVELSKIYKARYCQKYEYFIHPKWEKLKQRRYVSEEDAFQYRVVDAMKLLNEFHLQVEAKSPLEEFLGVLYKDFASRLAEMELVNQCPWCKEFVPFVKGKKYCSILADGRDCGTPARNRRYYQTRGKKNLHKYRKRTKELRDYYKKMGVKK